MTLALQSKWLFRLTATSPRACTSNRVSVQLLYLQTCTTRTKVSLWGVIQQWLNFYLEYFYFAASNLEEKCFVPEKRVAAAFEDCGFEFESGKFRNSSRNNTGSSGRKWDARRTVLNFELLRKFVKKMGRGRRRNLCVDVAISAVLHVLLILR